MNKIIGTLLMIVLSIYLILIFNEYSEDYDKTDVTVSFIAVENTASSEILYTHQLIYEIKDIHIDGIYQIIDDVVVSINVTEDGEIVLVNNASGTGDEILIIYSYENRPSQYTVDFIDAIPIIMIVMLLGGIGYMIIKR